MPKNGVLNAKLGILNKHQRFVYEIDPRTFGNWTLSVCPNSGQSPISEETSLIAKKGKEKKLFKIDGCKEEVSKYYISVNGLAYLP